MLSKNAIYSGQEGSAVFYAEKMETAARQRRDYVPTLFSICLEIAKRERWKQNAEGIKKSESILPFIDSLPQLLEKKYVPDITLYYSQFILKYTQSMYLQLGDTLKALSMQAISKKICAAISAKVEKGYTASLVRNIYSDYLFMQYQKCLYLSDEKARQAALKIIYADAVDAEQRHFNWAYEKKVGACIFLAYSFLSLHQLDSAEKYLHIVTGKPTFSDLAYNEQMLKLYADLEKQKGNYKLAFDYIERSAVLTDSITNATKMDIASNDYAQTEAEYNREELNIAAKEKVKRNWLIAGLILIIAITSVQFYFVNRRRRYRAKESINKLNLESQLQIAKLEEQNRIAKEEERKRLGMDLHDSLAGTLAAIKIQLESFMLAEGKLSNNFALKEIYNNILTAYKSTRQKSHDWFDSNEAVNNILFSERITAMFDRGLPSGKYEKEIWIDNASVKSLTLDQKIEYVYIINEAIANVLKHSKASKVSLSLYEEVSNELVLCIKDDGVGFNIERAKRGLGLKSLTERVKKIGGHINIISSKTGTEIMITKPTTVLSKSSLVS